ncbi:hypothetical protein QJS83_06680 [Bdellovibrio sp. 22V]|uniref:hypothetical protein n=1 Tax=Bdellovibrio TaxID=958 RepID=UPI00254275FC|nr:hypothetical protein [Bdellovibrio sp. 22V]WII73556.1 hypothetical protein QJS83_06680 [Bdellovibrio sp. 22V]
MRFLKGLLKCIGFFILGVVTCALVGLTAVSYYAVDQLTKASASEEKTAKRPPVAKASVLPSLPTGPESHTEVNPNLKELVRIGKSYDEELNLFDELAEKIAQKSVPDLCHTLCNPSYLDRERLANERTAYLVSYYKQEGTRALQDPLFRMKLEEVGFISRLYPPSLRKIMVQIEEAKSAKFKLALQLETAVVKEIYHFTFRFDQMKQDAEKLKTLRELIRSCQRGIPRKNVISECHSQIAN